MTSILTRPAAATTALLDPRPVRVAVIGYGYWGPNLARNVAQHTATELAAVVDLDPARLRAAGAAYPSATMTPGLQAVLTDPSIDAVVVATPPETHHTLVRAALQAGKHVLVEKPLATSIADAEDLVRLAEERGLVLSVDHTFLYTGAVRRMKRYFEEGEVGQVYYYDSTRINLGVFQHHTNVIWDLAPHDVSIMLHLLDRPVATVSALGARHVDMDQENIAYLTLQFDGPLLAHFHVNWLAPTKVRRTIIGGSKKMLVYDDLEPDEKLKVYDSGAQLATSVEDVHRRLVEYRTGDVLAPKLEKTEALAVETGHFARAVRGLEPPLSDGKLGLEVVRVIDAAQRSLQAGGVPMAVAR